MILSASRRVFCRSTLTPASRRLLSSNHANVSVRAASRQSGTSSARAACTTMATLAACGTAYHMSNSEITAFCAARMPTSGDILTVGSPTKEKATGILFPPLCNAMSLAGTGVRIKYVFVKVYAVGTYMDPIAMMAVKKGGPAAIQKALLDPTYPRTIRIVMNRGLSIDKYTAAIVESLEPRMNGQDLEKLDEFKQLNPSVDLVEGAEMEMTIRGDSLLYKNALGGVGTIRSRIFTEALCDVYYGDDCVSPTHKEEVLKGIPNL